MGSRSLVKSQEVLFRIFRDKTPDLYWVAFLITGHPNQSADAFTSTLNVDYGNQTFRDFMLSWARKLVIGPH
jgi:hypothetical protein